MMVGALILLGKVDRDLKGLYLVIILLALLLFVRRVRQLDAPFRGRDGSISA